MTPNDPNSTKHPYWAQRGLLFPIRTLVVQRTGFGSKKKLESVKKKNWIVPFTTQIKKKYCTAMCYQDFNSKILRLSFSLTSFSLSTSSAIPPRLSHRQLPPLYLQTELKCPWPLRPSLWCGLVWIWQHFEWLCYSVPLFFRLVCWYAVMTKDWWLKKNFFSSRPGTKTSSSNNYSIKLQDHQNQSGKWVGAISNQNYKLDIFSTTDTQPPAYPGHLDRSQPLFYFVPLSDSHSQHPAHPGNQNLTCCNS